MARTRRYLSTKMRHLPVSVPTPAGSRPRRLKHRLTGRQPLRGRARSALDCRRSGAVLLVGRRGETGVFLLLGCGEWGGENPEKDARRRFAL